MPTIPLKFYTTTVNGRPELIVAPGTNVPYGYSETDFAGALNTLRSGYQTDIATYNDRIASGAANANIQNSLKMAQEALTKLNAGDYSIFSKYGLGPEQVTQMQSGQSVASPYSNWNGAIVDTSKIPELEASGATVSGRNVVGLAVPGLNPPTSGSGYPSGGKTPLPQVTEDVIKKMYDAGYVINPNAQINEKSIDEFLAVAGKEIDPYYQTQLKLVSDSLKKNLGYSVQELQQSETETEKKYGVNLRTLGETSAEQGFALSGIRQRDERTLADETQTAIDTARRQLSYGAGQAVGEYAQKYAGIPGFELPGQNINQAPRVLAGEGQFQRGNEQRGLYELSPSVYEGLVGSEEFARRGAIKRRASDLEQTQNTENALIRTLNT